MWAAAFGDADAVDFLLKRGDDVNAKDQDGWTALHHAALGGQHAGVISLLINAGANVNEKAGDGSVVLAMCAAQGKVGEVRILIQPGADLEVRDQQLYAAVGGDR